MEIRFVSIPPFVVFRLDAVDQTFAPALRDSGWSQVDGGWQRDVPEDVPSLDRIQANFAASAEPMLRQLAGLAPVPWEDALAAFADRAESAGIEWWLTGSAATALRVPGIEPHDLDVMFAPEQVDRVRATFADVLVLPVLDTGGWVVRLFGVLFLHARIDLAASPIPTVDEPEPVDFGRVAAGQLEHVPWRGRTIRVPPLALQAAVNRRRGRIDRADMIEAHLAGH